MAFKRRDKALDNLGPMAGRAKIGISESTHMIGQHLVRQSQTGQRDGSKSGAVYGTHQASAPGEYSAPITYELHNSTSYSAGVSHVEFGVEAEHGLYQELGTRHMLPRPNLKNAVDESQDEIGPMIGGHVYRKILGL